MGRSHIRSEALPPRLASDIVHYEIQVHPHTEHEGATYLRRANNVDLERHLHVPT